MSGVNKMTSSTATESRPVRQRAVPPLEPGDRLTRAEFERRYAAMPELKKAELIEGVVYMPTPVRYESHSEPHGRVVVWLGTYAAHTPGVYMGDNGTVRLDEDNELQPDALLRIETDRGGQSRISEDDYIEGAPELVAEVASSCVSIDLHAKLNVYRRNGVREYIVWRVQDGEIDWFMLRGGEYQRLQPDQNGIIKSEVFPGLWLDAPAMLRGDMRAVLAALERGTQSPQHAEFVQRLSASSK